jgi:hypothetical protein
MGFPFIEKEPDEFDPTSETVIYKGWKIVDSTDYKIQKMIFNSDGTISRRYATGAWIDRSTLTYE